LAPLYHPLRLAEEVALLDLFSGGRVNWGAPAAALRGSNSPPLACLREESVSRFHETVEIVLKAWTKAKLTFAGKHFHIEDVEVLPKTSAGAASAGMGGGEFGGGDRLGGRPRLFDPDGPALVGPGRSV
jgi:alkanesulfonate monooxygenase SsuD/methylene tetrahydromethanopterin reductase-like flavin-dependent oxidoreductase (luciferase family)